MTVECVPNLSEGRDRDTIAALEQAVRATGAALLDSTSDADHNRTVLTIAGDAATVAEAAFEAARVAVERIDLTQHNGVHPRIGAIDVIPFVPVEGATLGDCAALAHAVGERLFGELGLPVYFYEAAALREPCRRLENVRRLIVPPDLGGGPHPTAGYCAVGARKFLVAWNIELESDDLESAQQIARAIRESNGGLKAVKALGLALPSRERVQVSINLVDFEVTPLHRVFDEVHRMCQERGIAIAGSELIGLIPRAALEASTGHDLRWLNLRTDSVLETAIELSRSL